jgi:hypothetical protein
MLVSLLLPTSPNILTRKTLSVASRSISCGNTNNRNYINYSSFNSAVVLVLKNVYLI